MTPSCRILSSSYHTSHPTTILRCFPELLAAYCKRILHKSFFNITTKLIINADCIFVTQSKHDLSVTEGFRKKILLSFAFWYKLFWNVSGVTPLPSYT
jgi:hypothetical protein